MLSKLSYMNRVMSDVFPTVGLQMELEVYLVISHFEVYYLFYLNLNYYF